MAEREISPFEIFGEEDWRRYVRLSKQTDPLFAKDARHELRTLRDFYAISGSTPEVQKRRIKSGLVAAGLVVGAIVTSRLQVPDALPIVLGFGGIYVASHELVCTAPEKVNDVRASFMNELIMNHTTAQLNHADE